MDAELQLSGEHISTKLKLYRGEEWLDSGTAAAKKKGRQGRKNCRIKPTWKTEQKTVPPLMETSAGHRWRQKEWYAGGIRSLSICSVFQQGHMGHSVLQACLFFISQLHFHPWIRVCHKVTLAGSLALKKKKALQADNCGVCCCCSTATRFLFWSTFF